MSETDFARQLDDQFVPWQHRCMRMRATPLVCIARTTAPGPEITILGMEDAPPEEVRAVLYRTLRLVDEGRWPLEKVFDELRITRKGEM